MTETQQQEPSDLLDGWVYCEGWRRAHRLAPAGASGKLRARCGTLTAKTPMAAPDTMAHCGGCESASAARPWQDHRPVVGGRS